MLKSKTLRKIESLHPKNDAWEIVRLSMHYEFPWDYNRASEYALYKTYAVPSISKLLHATKEFEKNPQKRYDDTDLLLSLIIENGITQGKGKDALERMNWIHSNYKISNDDYLYILSTFIFDIYYWLNKYAYRKLIHNEELAGFYVWQEIGKKMHIQHIPETIEEFRRYHDNYERMHFKYETSNAIISKVTENLMLSWYLPEISFDMFRPYLHAVMEPHLLKALGRNEPGFLKRNIVAKALKTRSKLESIIPRKHPFIRSINNFYKSYPNGFLMNDLGPQKLMTSPTCPFHKNN
ncbi:MAG TPA: hypothetical protein PLJ42_09225 [Chitinophagales bacterium]|jgi:hypothetical protein|nr:hypothetical protein [Chitinophagales bacterium]HQW79604.1 hypothetical protein [Chitinophagales bacterium]HRB68033.1 hypothetical protein [Chitinophagales bacterium]HRB92829.1 hypothetical protein [Chitinophagales bacterium]